MKENFLIHVSDMVVCFDHVANMEIYRCGVDKAAGLAVKYLAKLAASAISLARSKQLSLSWFFKLVRVC